MITYDVRGAASRTAAWRCHIPVRRSWLASRTAGALLRAHVQRVAEAVANEVHRYDRCYQEQTGDGGQPPVAELFLLRERKHRAPARIWVLQPEAKEIDRCFAHDGACDRQGGGYQNRAQCIWQHMPEDDPRGRDTDRACC